MRHHYPLLVYDGDCGFCRKWVERWKRRTGDRVDYAPYQEAASRFPQIPYEQFEKGVKLIEIDGSVSSDAEAVFRVLGYGGNTVALWSYKNIPGFQRISEYVYRYVAAHRARTTCVTPQK